MSENNFGAFVEIDNNKLTRAELVMLGMKEGLDHFIAEFSYQADAQKTERPWVTHVLRECIGRMEAERDKIAVQLTKSAMAHKAASLNSLTGNRIDG